MQHRTRLTASGRPGVLVTQIRSTTMNYIRMTNLELRGRLENLEKRINRLIEIFDRVPKTLCGLRYTSRITKLCKKMGSEADPIYKEFYGRIRPRGLSTRRK